MSRSPVSSCGSPTCMIACPASGTLHRGARVRGRSRRSGRPGYGDGVSRVHDMGGQTGFGPVPVDDDGQYFHADWEARVYALVRVLQRRGFINAQFDDLRDAIERIPPAEYLTLSYYERWLRATEMLLTERGLLADG